MIDSHCHLADEVYAADLTAVVARAHAAGVTRALCILSADEAAEVARAATVRAAWPGIRFAAGVHPHRAGAFADCPRDAAAAVVTAMDASNASAIGEIGLDYHYDHSPRAVQREVFVAQLALARERDVPVAIHTREAFADTLDILREYRPSRVVIHCFTETVDDARRALDLDCYISLAGIVTFPKAGSLRAVAGFVPSDRLLAETDAPFLSPVPYRGKRNEPAWVAETVLAIAAERREDAATLAEQVVWNFDRFMGEGR